MFDTNILLSIGFSLISNFAQVVEIPPEWVPRQLTDLRFCLIGGPNSPVEMNLIHRAGSQFWISHGVVDAYASPGSYFRLQDPAQIPNFIGATTLTSNDVVQIARNALLRLVKNGDPLNDGPPRVRYAGNYKGERIPFFRVAWPKSSPGSSTAAEVEIDGRSGRIVALSLYSPGFENRAAEEQVKKTVNAPERPKARPVPDWSGLPKPSTNYVVQAISNWLAFCRTAGLDTGSQTALDFVDWEKTFVSRQSYYSNMAPVARVCWIEFKNGSSFSSFDAVTCGHYTADAAFQAREQPTAYYSWEQFEGKPTYDWQTLAAALETTLTDKLGFPKSMFKKAPAELWSAPAFRTGHTLTRARVIWTPRPSEPDAHPMVKESTSLLRAEFDLKTGEVKSLEFNLHRFQDQLLFNLLRDAARFSSRESE